MNSFIINYGEKRFFAFNFMAAANAYENINRASRRIIYHNLRIKDEQTWITSTVAHHKDKCYSWNRQMLISLSLSLSLNGWIHDISTSISFRCITLVYHVKWWYEGGKNPALLFTSEEIENKKCYFRSSYQVGRSFGRLFGVRCKPISPTHLCTMDVLFYNTNETAKHVRFSIKSCKWCQNTLCITCNCMKISTEFGRGENN